MGEMKCNSAMSMLDHFKKEHECTNRALIESGEGKRYTKWEESSIPVKDIVEFMQYRTSKG